MTEYTETERQTLRTAAFGAMMLVSNADPGFLATIKESMAGSRVLAQSSAELRELIRSGGLPHVPQESPAEMEDGVLDALRQSVAILRAKGPTEVEGFRDAILAACDSVAGASGGVTAPETAAVAKVRAALHA